jgi:N-acetylglutamate synthase-like GNAT family acetyltransferase
MKIRKLHASELSWANERYAEINFVPSSESDFIAVAELNGIKAGLGRVTAVNDGIGELGGMVVLPEFRGQAIAAKIVEFLLSNCGISSLYCIPFSHLQKFYRRFGFLPVDQTISVPMVVAEKYTWCHRTYDTPVALLYRQTWQTNIVRQSMHQK